jgi:hypothetical protein
MTVGPKRFELLDGHAAGNRLWAGLDEREEGVTSAEYFGFASCRAMQLGLVLETVTE